MNSELLKSNMDLVEFIEDLYDAEYNSRYNYFYTKDDDYSPTILRTEEILSGAVDYFDSIGLFIVIRPFLYGEKALYRSIYMKKEDEGVRSIYMSVEDSREEALILGLTYMLENKETL